jgi:hypothetical protein
MKTKGAEYPSTGSGLGITRRGWAALLASAPLLAQTAATPQNPPPLSAPAADTPEQRLAKAFADVRTVSDRLAQTEVPMGVEPAFTFHV